MEKMPDFQNSSKENKGVSRRDFLKIIGGALAYLSLPESVKAGVAGVKKNDHNQENPPVSIKNQIIEKETSVDQVEITPEYQRNMEKVLLSVPSNKEFSPEEIRKIYYDLLVKMPKYSIIQVLAGEGQEENFKKIIDEIQEQEGGVIDSHQRLQIMSTNDMDEKDMWAQDFGEMAKINGKATFIIPADFKGPFYDSPMERDKKRKKEVVKWLQKQGLEVKQADFYFDGGNVTFDKTEDGLRVFVGYSTIFYSQHLEKNRDQKPTPKMIAQQISQCFGGAEVVVMGDKELINICFHIDQAFVILDGKQAVVNQCASPCFDGTVDVSQQLQY